MARCVDVLGLRTGCASLRNAEFRIMVAVHCVSLVPVRCGPLRLVLDVLEAQPRSRCRGPREGTVLRLVRVRLELRLRLRLRLRRRRRLTLRVGVRVGGPPPSVSWAHRATREATRPRVELPPD